MQQFIPGVRLALYFSFFGLAVSFTSAPFVIAKSFEYNIAQSQALNILVLQQFAAFFTAFGLSAFVPSAGHKRMLLFSLGLLCLVGGLMPIKGDFLLQYDLQFMVPEIFYVVTGVGFGLIKTIVYSYCARLAATEGEHASLLNRLEACYTAGALVGLVLFGGLSLNPAINLEVHYVFVPVVVLTAIIAYVVLQTPLPDLEADDLRAQYGWAYRLGGMLEVAKLLPYTLVIMFLISLLLFSLVESHLFSWTPAYLKNVVQCSEQVQVQFLMACLAAVVVGKLVMSYLVVSFSPYYWLLIAMSATLGTLLLFIWLASGGLPPSIPIETWATLPGYLFLFLVFLACAAAIAPTLCAMVLWHTPARKQATMVGLMIMLNMVGWVAGDAILAYLASAFGPVVVLAFLAVPFTLLLTVVLLFTTDLRRSRTTTTS
jgi:MFS family permease